MSGTAAERPGHSLLARLRAARDDEAGSMLPLVIGYGVLALALILVVVATTSLSLERKRLLSVADGAALAAAEAFDSASLTVDADGRATVRLDDAAVAAAAAAYLADVGDGLHDLRLVEAASPDGRTVRVRVAAVWHAPLSNEWIPARVPLEVESEARSILH